MAEHPAPPASPSDGPVATNGSERRRFTRVHAPVPVTVSSQNNFYAGVSNDISEGGVFVVTRSPPPVGTFVELSLVLEEGGEPIPVRGVARWHRIANPGVEAPPGVGIQFLELTPEVQARLERFLRVRDTILWESD